MREYFTILVQENSKENLGLLTEKLNDGFYIDQTFNLGRSTLMVLQKRNMDSLVLRNAINATETVTGSY
jgi:hypothetical protein